MPKTTPYYKDKATQIAALRVTKNSHFREASSLKSFCYTFKFPLKATRQQRSFLHTMQYIFKPLVYRTKTSTIYVSFASLCFGDKMYEPKTKTFQM